MLDPADLYDAEPASANGTAVLLLAGSSGRIESARADLLAATGARVRAVRWFGGAGQRPAPHEVPLELFTEQIEVLRQDADRVVLFGTSFGAEGALAVASRHPVDGVIAVAPSSVVWAGMEAGSWSSHWTHRGEPVPCVSFDPGWEPDADPPAYVSLYESSLQLDAAVTAAARIHVEDIMGEVMLVVGGDDRVWPSARFAAEIRAAREAGGLRTTVVSHPRAGHRLLLPGESPAAGGVTMQRGGAPDADAELGMQAWPQTRRMLAAPSEEH